MARGFGSGTQLGLRYFRWFFTCFDDIGKNNHKEFIQFKSLIGKLKTIVLVDVPLPKPLATAVKRM